MGAVSHVTEPHPLACILRAPSPGRRWIPRHARHAIAALVCAAVLATGSMAHGQQVPPGDDPNDPIDLDVWRESALLTGSALALILAPLISVDTTPPRPTSEWFPGDESVKNNFSLRADRISDVTIALTVAAPLALHLPVDEPAARRALVYGESLAINLALVQVVKYAVQRPRPFNHHTDGRVRAFAARRGRDSQISFFSGHSSTAFTAAVAGSYLYAMQAESERARAAVWGAHLALAAATASLRVRAGRHYYSDIAVGAIVGMGIGVSVPLLHARDGAAHVPTGLEWGAMAGGILLGVTAGQLVPLEADPAARAETTLTRVRLLPMASPGGAGLVLAGGF